jgi:polyisoprenoid-binding protein YceI
MLGKELWEIDGSASRLGFSLRHIVITEISGRFGRWGGQMIFDPEDVDRSLIKVWIDVASIDTGSGERDAHLRSPEFLDVARFPRAEFTSTGVDVRRDGQARLTGPLRLHGVSRNVELDLATERTWTDDAGRLRAAYRLRGRLDRQAFGLHWNQDLDVGGIVVGDEVEIEARVELVRIADSIVIGERRAAGDPAPSP